MIHIHTHDTLVDIIEKIEGQDKENIILFFPLGHPILHNYISLKVLKSKADKNNQELIIVSNDVIGKKIGKNLGIKYTRIKNNKTYQKNIGKNNLMQYNFTFWEYLIFQIRAYKNEFTSHIEANKSFNSLGKYSKYYKQKNSLHIFFIILIATCLLFLFIYYFVINKSYIYITPESVIRNEASNFVFNENKEDVILGNNRNITIKTISQKIESKEIFASTGIQTDISKTASGKIVISNTFLEAKQLITGTRFQSPEGIIFQIKDGVEIPAGFKDNFGNISPGKLEVVVEAKLKDISGKYIGTAGNISSGTSLILPGLSNEDQLQIYAESIEEFSGGSDSFQKNITENDIETAKKLFEESLKSKALTSLKNTISTNNITDGTQYDILPGGKGIQYNALQIDLDDDTKIGNIQNNFTLKGSITIQAYIYDKSDIITKLRSQIEPRLLNGIEKLAYIDENSLRMSQILYIRENTDATSEQKFEQKATFEIQYIVENDLLKTQGSYYELLKEKIRGVPKEEAQKILINDPKISNTRIEIRPFFVDTISNISENIIFKTE